MKVALMIAFEKDEAKSKGFERSTFASVFNQHRNICSVVCVRRCGKGGCSLCSDVSVAQLRRPGEEHGLARGTVGLDGEVIQLEE